MTNVGGPVDVAFPRAVAGQRYQVGNAILGVIDLLVTRKFSLNVRKACWSGFPSAPGARGSRSSTAKPGPAVIGVTFVTSTF